MTNQKIKEGLPKTKEGLPWQAFAIVGDKDEPDTWKLPHHTKSIFRAIKGKIGIERTVDWDRMPAAVAALSPGGYRGQRVDATDEEIIQAAKRATEEKIISPILIGDPDKIKSLCQKLNFDLDSLEIL